VPFKGIEGGVGGVWKGGGMGKGNMEEDENELCPVIDRRTRRSSSWMESANPKDLRVSRRGLRFKVSCSWLVKILTEGLSFGMMGGMTNKAAAPSQGVSTEGQSVSPTFSRGCRSQQLSSTTG
jgi:hypothetical protein